MSYKTLKLKNHTIEDINKLVSEREEFQIGIKLHAVKKAAEGMSSRKLTEFYGLSFKQICNWFHSFDEKGIDGLIKKKNPGKESRLNKEQLEKLKEIVTTKIPSDYGYTTGTWTGLLLIDWIEKNYNIAYKKAQIYNILKKLSLTYKKGRGVFPERDEEKREEFKKEIKKNS